MATYKKIMPSDIEELKAILKKGGEYGLDFNDQIEKIENLMRSIKEDTIKIVFVSSYSDGKTSTIAGLLGRVEKDMLIDIKESSNRIIQYHPEGFPKDFVIVDTPGLFGNKEEEDENNKIVKLSEMTEKYISEAHVLIYICDANNPLKNSHAPMVKYIMRDLRKLDSTVFVINKMDRAGYDPSDETNFQRGSTTKKAFLIQRLRDTIGLTVDEENELPIVCISASPDNDGAGISEWLKTPDEYVSYSHIENLRNTLGQVITKANKEKLQNDANNSSIIEVTSQILVGIDYMTTSLNKAIDEIDSYNKDLHTDLEIMKKEILQNKQDMTERLLELKKQSKAEINAATIETKDEVLGNVVGVVDDKVTYYILNRKINQIIQECSQGNNSSIDKKVDDIISKTQGQETIIKELLKKAADAIGKKKVSGDTVKKVRDVVAKEYKFHPWEAIKIGDKISKGLNYAGKGINVVLTAYDWYNKQKQNEALNKLKKDINDDIEAHIQDIFNDLNNDDMYFYKYAPRYLKLLEQYNDRFQEINTLKVKKNELDNYKGILTEWAKRNANEVPFTKQ